MEQCCLASVVEPEEQQLRMFVQQPERGEDIPDCRQFQISMTVVLGQAVLWLGKDRWLTPIYHPHVRLLVCGNGDRMWGELRDESQVKG